MAKRLFGWVDRVDGTCGIATSFFQLGGLPLLPEKTHLVDTTTLEVERGALREQTSYMIVPQPRLDKRSVFAGYARTWGSLAAGVLIAAAAQSGYLLLWGLILWIAAWVLVAMSQLRLASAIGLGAWAAITGSFTPITWPVVVLGLVGAIAAATTLVWRRATLPRAFELGGMLGIADDDIELRHQP